MEGKDNAGKKRVSRRRAGRTVTKGIVRNIRKKKVDGGKKLSLISSENFINNFFFRFKMRLSYLALVAALAIASPSFAEEPRDLRTSLDSLASRVRNQNCGKREDYNNGDREDKASWDMKTSSSVPEYQGNGTRFLFLVEDRTKRKAEDSGPQGASAAHGVVRKYYLEVSPYSDRFPLASFRAIIFEDASGSLFYLREGDANRLQRVDIPQQERDTTLQKLDYLVRNLPAQCRR